MHAVMSGCKGLETKVQATNEYFQSRHLESCSLRKHTVCFVFVFPQVHRASLIIGQIRAISAYIHRLNQYNLLCLLTTQVPSTVELHQLQCIYDISLALLPYQIPER